MKRWKVPVVWQMIGYITVEAKTAEEAAKLIEAEDQSLPEGNYLDESFEVDREGVMEM